MTTKKPSPILSIVKAEGFSEGVGQASQVSFDEGYYAGQCDARREAPSRLTWWMLGGLSWGVAAVLGVLL